MNILVTGGFGFIGSHFVKLMISLNHNVTVVDTLTYASDKRRLGGLYLPVHIKDINSCRYLKYIISNYDIDAIVNFAAETHVDRSIINSAPFIHSNVMGVRSLLDSILDYKVRFIQISTDEVYGSIEKGSFLEDDKLNPSNPYSASKASADLLTLSYVKTHGVDAVITRSTNNYGPFQHVEKFIPRMISLAIKGRPLEVYGSGTNVRDWLYVVDNCEGIYQSLLHGEPGEIYNIGGGCEKSNNEIARLISSHFNVPVSYIDDRPGHDLRYSVDFSKISNLTGWKPKVSFEDGMLATIEHCKEVFKL